MKYILIICGVLAIMALVQANPQQADEENQGVNAPGRFHSRPYVDPYRRPQIYRNQQPSRNENVNSQGPQGRPRPHHPHFEPKPQPQLEQESDQNESEIPELQPVLLDGNDFSILNNAGNGNSLENSSANRRRSTTTTTTTSAP